MCQYGQNAQNTSMDGDFRILNGSNGIQNQRGGDLVGSVASVLVAEQGVAGGGGGRIGFTPDMSDVIEEFRWRGLLQDLSDGAK